MAHAPPPSPSRLRRIARRLTGRVDTNLQDTLKRQADALERREEALAFGQAITILLDTYREAGYTHVRLQNAVDHQVCPACRERRGRVYRIDEAPRLLAEICENGHCRCFYTPISSEDV